MLKSPDNDSQVYMTHLPTQGTVYCSCAVARDPVLGRAIVVTSFSVHAS